MSRKNVLTILVVLASGSFATLVSAFFAQDLTLGRIGASTTGYGLPLSWYRKHVIVSSGNATVYSFSLESFVFDVTFWALVIGILNAAIVRWLKARK